MRLSVAARSAITRRSRAQRGAVAVEFALVLLFLLLPLVFGIMQYGLYFWAFQGGSDVTRDAARRAAVGSPADCNSYVTGVRAEVSGLRAVDSPEPVVTRDYAKDAGNTEAGVVQVGDKVTVRVE